MRKLKEQLESQCLHLSRLGYDTHELVFEEPATEAEVRATERQLGLPLPGAFRASLLSISRHVEFRWFAPDGTKYPSPFRSNFSGDLHWSLEFTRQFNEAKEGWVKEVFPSKDDEYDAVWHDKLAFYEVGNGDLIAIDLAPASYEQIVYLSHDDGEGHGYVLADDFADLLRRWVPLSCAGGEDWQWLPFTTARTSRLQPDDPNGRAWRACLGLA